MSTNGRIPDELELLAYIEGELDTDRATAVLAYLDTNPTLKARVRAIRGDREALRTLGPVRAPSDLLARVESILERQALLGLATAEPTTPTSLPRSAVLPPRRPSVVIRTLRSPWTHRLSVAAAAGLLIGAGVYGLLLVRGHEADQRIIAMDDGEGSLIEELAVREAAPETQDHSPTEGQPDKEPIRTLAMRSAPAPTAPEAKIADMGIAETGADATVPSGVEVASDTGSLTPERALALAREGRLAIRVASHDGSAAAAVTESIAAGQPGRTPAWPKLGPAALPENLAAVASIWEERATGGADLSPARAPAPPMIAGRNDLGPSLIPPAPSAPLSFLTPGPMPIAVYLADVPEREGTLVSLLAALRRDGVSAEFVELPEPIDAPPALEPSTVLWWTYAPSQWTRKLTVPVVVESGLR